MQSLVVIAVLGAAMAITACGNSADEKAAAPPPTDREAVSRVVTHMYASFAAGDADGVCSTMSKAAREEIAQTVPGGSTQAPGDRTCEASFSKFLDAAAATGIQQRTGQAEVIDVSVKGNHAVAMVSLGGATGRMSLVKEQGDWRFDGSPLRPTGPVS
jgi:hypothetical protein